MKVKNAKFLEDVESVKCVYILNIVLKQSTRTESIDVKINVNTQWEFVDHATLPRHLYQPKKEEKQSNKHKHIRRRNTIKKIKPKVINVM